MSTVALRFPSNASRVNSANLSTHSFDEGITFEVWARREGNGNRGTRGIAFSNGTWYVDFYNSSVFRISTRISNTQRTWHWGTMVPNHGWVHLALTYNRQTVKFYVNGELAGSTNISGTVTGIGEQVLGGYSGGTDYSFIGSIKGHRVYNLEKTQEQIKHDMFLSVPTYSKGIILNHSLEEGTGETVKDLSPYQVEGQAISCEWVNDGIFLTSPIDLKIKENEIIVRRATDYPFEFQIINNGVGQWKRKDFDSVASHQLGNLTVTEYDVEPEKWEDITSLRVK
ncbi:LamG domain-containing protein [Bacillus horti]|uniref:LamG domain-containing protein n=1 Tax=Caldalkalibacillus horti TaxID=77523 RepID=A0ABT9VVY4_9BACI|nr:LamG domain-containing protein [Bacillus horti]MDQ0165156.1 hypothetical protein [Bacillus horti]